MYAYRSFLEEPLNIRRQYSDIYSIKKNIRGVNVNIDINDVSQRYDVQSSEEMNRCWMDITKEIMNDNQIIYSIEIDGVVYYDDYANVLLTKYNQIDTLKITTVTKEQSLFITLQDLQQYAAKVISEMSDYIKPLYSGSLETPNNILPTVIESIQWIVNASSFVQHLCQEVVVDALLLDIINRMVEQFNPILQLLTEELEWGNMIGFADIIQYEFIPLVEEFYLKSKEVEVPVEANGYQQ